MLTCTGNLTTDTNGHFSCSGEWVQLNILEMLLSNPEPEQIQIAFQAGFILPVTAFLAAYSLGVLIKFVK